MVFNYKARIFRIIDAVTFDAEINMGFRERRDRRVKLLDVELPDKKSRDPADKELWEKGKDALEALIMGRRLIMSPTRPNMYSRTMARLYIPCRRASDELPELTKVAAGSRFLNVSLMMNLAAGKRFDLEYVKRVTEGLELHDI